MIVLEFVKQHLPGSWRMTPSGWTSGNCPMCATRGHKADTRRRGGVMFTVDSVQYNCFNCGFKAGWSPGIKISKNLKELLVIFGADPAHIQRVNFELLKQEEHDNIAKQFIPEEQAQLAKVSWEPEPLPDNSRPLDQVDTSELTESQLEKFVAACEYVQQRGLGFYDKWHWSNFKHFENRVILPFYYQNKIVGYTARWVMPNRQPEIPKYYLRNPQNFVYNLDAQASHEYVIVTEGPLDALLVGGVALNGNSPNTVQCTLIDQLNKKVILVPDFDKSGSETIGAAIKHGWAVSFPPWENCKDAGDAVEKYGRLFTVRSILDSAETGSTKIQLLAKQYCK